MKKSREIIEICNLIINFISYWTWPRCVVSLSVLSRAFCIFGPGLLLLDRQTNFTETIKVNFIMFQSYLLLPALIDELLLAKHCTLQVTQPRFFLWAMRYLLRTILLLICLQICNMLFNLVVSSRSKVHKFNTQVLGGKLIEVLVRTTIERSLLTTYIERSL